ncbi:MAG: CspA family cold shock protein [Cellvibrionaceae bacterium]|jgi:CspA family cold shock protein
MATGKVKWFNNAKGYGFILSEDESEDLFAHYTSIEMEGYKTLRAGQAVNFEITKGDKGLHAVSITAKESIEEAASVTGETTSEQLAKSHLETS